MMNIYSFLAISCLCLSSCDRLKELEEFVGLDDEKETEVVETGECVLGSKGFGKLIGASVDERSKMESLGGTSFVRKGDQRVSMEMDMWMNHRRWVQYYSDSKVRITILNDHNPMHLKLPGGMMKKEKGAVSPLLKKSVLFHLVDGVWQGTLESGEPTAKEVELIANMGRDLGRRGKVADAFGTELRQVGDEWTMSAEILDFDDASGDVKVTLVRLLDYDGMKCAELAYEFDVSKRESEKDWIIMKGTAKVYRSLEYFVDVYTETNASMDVMAEEGTVRSSGPVNATETCHVMLKQD